ncbi:MAG: IPT/TIG domain-containing protein [Planctomycetes bacterium]|nr:IPT/TIG domain-containing protein [Planctomycetota bacterium]
MRCTVLCHLLAWLAPLGHALAFEAPRITRIEPAHVSFGTRVTITGSGFTSRPTVFLTQATSRERVYFRVVSFRETEIVAIARDAASRAYDLNVKSNGETATLTQGIFIKPPSGLPFESPPALPGDRQLITGEGFGMRKGRVWLQPIQASWIREKPARVLAWNDTAIEFLVPELAVGYWSLRVENRVGWTYGVFAVSAPSSCVRVELSARLNGAAFVSTYARLHRRSRYRYELITESSPLQRDWAIFVRFTYDLEHGQLPAEVSGTAEAEISYFGPRPSGPLGLGLWRTDARREPFSIELLSAGEGCLHGRMTGTLLNDIDPRDIRRLELGEFRLFLPWRP